MNFNNANALNFSYLLIEFYKKIGLNEEELAVILVLDHLLSQGNNLTNSTALALNMTYDEKRIDSIMANLYERKLIEINIVNGTVSFSINPIKNILYKKFQESIFTEEELTKNNELEEVRSEVLQNLEKMFERSLTPLEINRVSDWLADDPDINIIREAIKEGFSKGYHSINQVDRSIVRRIRQAAMENDKWNLKIN